MIDVKGRASLGTAVAVAVLTMLAAGSASGAGQQAGRAVEQQIANVQGVPVAEVELPMGVDGRIGVFVEFMSPATASVYAEELEVRGGPGNPTAVESANQRAQAQLQAINQTQGQFLQAVGQLGLGHDLLYRAARSVNGVALRIDPADMERLRQLPGVRRVEVMYPHERNNASSVPFIGAPQVWDAVGLPQGSTGEGISIAVIDTGIDYQHAHFGGTGQEADYQANDTAVISDQLNGAPIFPTAKVVGGFDFAGNAYTGSNLPAPDPDPMDCNGHGSHVAGTAAGLGVTSDGTTFAGPYAAETDYGSLRIGPGVAPGADLYALRVFGCSGSTLLTVAAIEWAMDPNGDGNFSDRVDIINMSLGSNFGSRFDASSIATDNAARVGVTVVTSAGNAADTFFISGSPGAAGRAIAVANTLDPAASNATALRVDAPAGIAGFYGAGTASFGSIAPAGGLTGSLVLVDDGSGTTSDGCQDLVNGAAVAGNIALVDRGTCSFQRKAFTAEAAGAVGVIIANNAAGPAPGLGASPADGAVTVPVSSLSLPDANLFKANLPGVVVTLFAGGDNVAASSSRGPRRASPLLQVKPDIAAPGTNITSAQTGVIGPTSYAAGSLPLTISGTSMAAPHVAGAMALLRDLHPGLSVEEYKALAMNTALREITTLPEGAGTRHGSSRVGAGRVDVPAAAAGEVMAFNAEDPGLVSVSFESGVRGQVSRSRTVRLVNHSTQAQTFDIALDTLVDAPGVAFSTDASSITVPGSGSALVTVRMDADASEIDHVRDPALAAAQSPSAGTVNALFSPAIPRHYMTEESAQLTFSQAGGAVLRVPVYAAVYPEAAVTGAETIATAGAPSGSGSIALSGEGVCTGTPAAGSCDRPGATDQASLVSAFELQGVSPRNPFVDPARDVRFVGVAYDPAADRVNFGVASWGPWSSPTDVTYRVDIDCGVYAFGTSFAADTCTGAPDGAFDLRVIAVNRGTINQTFTGSSTSAIDVFQVFVIGLQPTRTSSALIPANHWVNGRTADLGNTRLQFNEVQFIGIDRATAKIGGAFAYRVNTCFGLSPLCGSPSDVAGPYTWNPLAQGLDFGGATLLDAQAGGSIPVQWNTANLAANGSSGALLLHHFNGEGERAQVVTLEGTTTVDGAVALTVDDPSASVGSVVTVTVTATNTSATDPMSSASVALNLPLDTTLLGDNGGGAFDGSSWVWDVGTLAPGASASLDVLLRVDGSGPQRLDALLGTGSLDGNSSNDVAAVWINAAASADVSVSFDSATSRAVAGEDALQFVIRVANQGPDQAFALNVSELFVLGGIEPLSPVSSSASVGSYDPVTGVWTMPSMAATGGAATLSLTFDAPEVTSTTTVKLRATASADVNDPSTGNNVAEAQLTVLPLLIFSDGLED